MDQKRSTQRCVQRARIAGLPVRRHPRPDQVRIKRPGAAEHQVDPGRLIQKVRIIETAAHLGFKPPDQPRQQHPLQAVLVDQVIALRQLGLLRQSQQPRRPTAVVLGQCGGGVQQRVDVFDIVVGHRIEFDFRKRLPVHRQPLIGPFHRDPAVDVGPPQQHRAGDRRQADRRKTEGAPQPPSQHPAGRARDQQRLAQNDVAQQPGHEVAASIHRTQAWHTLLINSERPRQHSGQPVDRRAFLRRRGQIDARAAAGRASSRLPPKPRLRNSLSGCARMATCSGKP